MGRKDESTETPFLAGAGSSGGGGGNSKRISLAVHRPIASLFTRTL